MSRNVAAEIRKVAQAARAERVANPNVLRRIDPDPDGLLPDRVALHVRLGSPGRSPVAQWASSAALIDLEIFGTTRMIGRAASTALAVYGRLGIRIDE